MQMTQTSITLYRDGCNKMDRWVGARESNICWIVRHKGDRREKRFTYIDNRCVGLTKVPRLRKKKTVPV